MKNNYLMKLGCTAFAAMLVLAGCTGKTSQTSEETSSESTSSQSQQAPESYTFKDSLGSEVTVNNPQKVVSLYGSFAEAWTLAGGTLAGVTDDAIKERKMNLGEKVSVIGTVKEPNMEEIVALSPDFVILSADIQSQSQLGEALGEMNIPYAYFRVDTYGDYLSMMENFCQITGRDDLFEQNATAVGQRVDASIKRSAEHTGDAPKVLLLRAFSTGVKAKGEDNLAGAILKDLGCDNIVARHESLLEDLSIEEIIAEDPDYIFVVVMGTDQQAAIDSITTGIGASPAWKDLKAVKNDKMIVLPKNLFHYKPNAAWGESYEYMENILYPQ